MIRRLGLISAGMLLVAIVGFGAGSPQTWASKVDCGKVMSEVKAGKKAKDIATDLKISTSSVYRCKKKDAAAKAGPKTASAATPAASPAAKH